MNDSSGDKRALVWFRRDLRTKDHAALNNACQQGYSILPVFLWDPWEQSNWKPGAASRWWLYKTLLELEKSIQEMGGGLLIKKGQPEKILPSLANSLGAGKVFHGRLYDPLSLQTESRVQSGLRERGIEFESFNTTLLNEPWEICNGSGNPFQVFTPYWRKAQNSTHNQVETFAPGELSFFKTNESSMHPRELGLLSKNKWHEKLEACWNVSQKSADKLLNRLRDEITTSYDDRRNQPGVDGTSRLSPYLAWGNISPQQVCEVVPQDKNNETGRGENQYLAEIGWREFSHHLLFHFPSTTDTPLRKKYLDFPWRLDEGSLESWQKGHTGYPLVDAGMRQLWETGWMHNRVRMVVASFLVKHLLLPWQQGAHWFWDTLVDADLASNTQGWQWAAGCGADAAPYFRIFNPFTQGEKFDPAGKYARKWIPEIAKLPSKWIYRPWDAPANVLEDNGVRLGQNYPCPIVSHKKGRTRALEALASLNQ